MKIFWILSLSSISFALLAHFCIFIKNPTNVLHKYLGTDYSSCNTESYVTIHTGIYTKRIHVNHV